MVQEKEDFNGANPGQHATQSFQPEAPLDNVGFEERLATAVRNLNADPAALNTWAYGWHPPGSPSPDTNMADPEQPSEPAELATFLPIPDLQQLERDIIGLIEQQEAAHPPHLITPVNHPPSNIQDILGHIQIATDLLYSTLSHDDNTITNIPNPSKSILSSSIPRYKVRIALQHLRASASLLAIGPPKWKHARPPEWKHTPPINLAERRVEIERVRAELGLEASIKNNRMIETRYMLGELELLGKLASRKNRVPRCERCERSDKRCVVVDPAMELIIRTSCCAWCYFSHSKCEDLPRESE